MQNNKNEKNYITKLMEMKEILKNIEKHLQINKLTEDKLVSPELK